MTSEILIRIGTVELTCRGDVDQEQLDGVLRTLRRQLPELMAQVAKAEMPSAREWLARSSAKTHGDKAGVVAYWLETQCGRTEWRSSDIVDALTEAELQSSQLTRWPFLDRPFADVAAWVNLELTKNAAEIGYARFLYAARP